MGKATLVIMAAGMGARYGGGGLKQVEGVGANGETLADYSVYDAKRAGFDKVLFIIKRDIEENFRTLVLDRFDRNIDVCVAYQEINNLPANAPDYAVKAAANGRKPWGTGHAVACCKGLVNEPFMVIGADDFFGRSAFESVFNFITRAERRNYCMAGYKLANTLSESGYVSRGVCVTENGFLRRIDEKTKIMKSADGEKIFFEEDGVLSNISGETTVSMNAWGFRPDFLDDLDNGFTDFLRQNEKNIATAEYYLPTAVQTSLDTKGATVAVLPTADVWCGVTRIADREGVVKTLQNYAETGVYPVKLW